MAGRNLLQFFRGTTTKRLGSTEVLNAGQPFYETDSGALYIGDGTTKLNSIKPINVNKLISDAVYDNGGAIRSTSFLKIDNEGKLIAELMSGSMNLLGTFNYTGGRVDINTNNTGGLTVDGSPVITTSSISSYIQPNDYIFTCRTNDGALGNSVIYFTIKIRNGKSLQNIFNTLGMNTINSNQKLYPCNGYFNMGDGITHNIMGVYSLLTGSDNYLNFVSTDGFEYGMKIDTECTCYYSEIFM